MSRMGDVMLSEKTKVGVSLATFCAIVIFLIVTAKGWGSWKATIEIEIKALQETSAQNEIDIKDMKDAVIETQTNVQWIKEAMQNNGMSAPDSP